MLLLLLLGELFDVLFNAGELAPDLGAVDLLANDGLWADFEGSRGEELDSLLFRAAFRSGEPDDLFKTDEEEPLPNFGVVGCNGEPDDLCCGEALGVLLLLFRSGVVAADLGELKFDEAVDVVAAFLNGDPVAYVHDLAFSSSTSSPCSFSNS